MILFLDPDPMRAVLAYQRMTEEDQQNTIWCRTYEEAQTTLWNYRDVLTKVHLEHDLGGRSYQNTSDDTSGMELVRYLEKLSIHHDDVFGAYKKMKFVVHTWNDHAGPIMTERLRKIGLKVELKPFGM